MGPINFIDVARVLGDQPVDSTRCSYLISGFLRFVPSFLWTFFKNKREIFVLVESPLNWLRITWRSRRDSTRVSKEFVVLNRWNSVSTNGGFVQVA